MDRAIGEVLGLEIHIRHNGSGSCIIKWNGDGSNKIGYTMASVLKNEIGIASIRLGQQSDPDQWQYIIRINED